MPAHWAQTACRSAVFLPGHHSASTRYAWPSVREPRSAVVSTWAVSNTFAEQHWLRLLSVGTEPIGGRFRVVRYVTGDGVDPINQGLRFCLRRITYAPRSTAAVPARLHCRQAAPLYPMLLNGGSYVRGTYHSSGHAIATGVNATNTQALVKAEQNEVNTRTADFGSVRSAPYTTGFARVNAGLLFSTRTSRPRLASPVLPQRQRRPGPGKLRATFRPVFTNQTDLPTTPTPPRTDQHSPVTWRRLRHNVGQAD